MKWVLFAVLLLLVGAVVGAAVLPMSMAADLARKQVRSFSFTGAAGSVWNGKLQGVVVQGQSLGDVSVKVDAGQLFIGKAVARISFSRLGLTGEAAISRGLFGGKTGLRQVRLDGQVKAVPVLPTRIRAADGRFTLAVDQAVFDRNGCQSASGEVWSDALSKTDLGHHWVGPELRGPVRCSAGRLEADAVGKAPTGEDVTAGLGVGANFAFDLQARVTNATPGAVETLTELGFQPASGGYELHQQLGAASAALGQGGAPKAR